MSLARLIMTAFGGLTLSLLPVGAVVGLADTPADPRMPTTDTKASDELTQMGGCWRIIKAEMDGTPREESFTITFKNGRFTRKGKTQTYTGSYQLDPSARPRQITIIKDEGESKKPLLGIYEIKGKILTLCFGRELPSEFATKAGQNVILLVLKHEAASSVGDRTNGR
jgi:uncharacterized protein (TIGR03067 family)